MPSSRPPPHLRVVEPVLEPGLITPDNSKVNGLQLALPLERPRTLFVVNMSCVSRAAFLAFIATEKPRCLFDVRAVPTFDVENLTRRTVFGHFAAENVAYVDVAGLLGRAWSRDAALSSGAVSNAITEFLAERAVEPDRVGVLLDNREVSHWTAHRLHERIRPSPREGWHLEMVPRTPRLVSR